MQQQPTFNFGLTKKPKTIKLEGQTPKNFLFYFIFQVTYPYGFGLCKKRERKILTLGHL